MAPRLSLRRRRSRPRAMAVSVACAATAVLLLLGLFCGLSAAQPPRLPHDATIVTDLRVVRGASDAAAREACAALCPCRAALTTHVVTNWFVVGDNLHAGGDGAFAYLCARRDRRAAVDRDGGSLFALQSIAVLAGERQCPPSMTRLFTPRDGVVVCLQTASMTHALATGMYVSDVDAVAATSDQRDRVRGWLSDPTSAHVGTTADAPAVHIYFKRPLRPIVDVRVLSGVDAETSGAMACRRQLDLSWEQAGNGYIVDEQDASTRHVVCLQRPVVPIDEEATEEDAPALRVLTQIQVVASTASCGVAFQEQTVVASSWKACLKFEDASSTTRFLSHVMLATTSATNAQPLVNGFSLVSTADLNGARGGLATYIMAQDSSAVVNSRQLSEMAIEASEAIAADNSKPIPLASRPPLRAHVVDADTSDPKLVFKVLQIADLHLTGDPDRYCLNPSTEVALCGMQCNENLTVAFLNDLLDAEKPDLVMFSGDTITVRFWELKDAAVEAALRPVEARGIPYAWIMGNHDDDWVYDRHEIMDKLVKRKLAYVESGPSEIQGVGNYVLDVKPPVSSAWGSKDAAVFRMYFLDSNKNHDAERFPNIKSRYDWIRAEQIAFYDELSRRNQQSDVDGPVPAIMFFHIPIPEYASLGSLLFRQGEKNEKTEGPDFNSGMLTKLAERGEVKATFVGHDHTNEYCYKTQGVQLCYGGGTGFGAAVFGGSVARRARVIEWTMDSARRRRITSWKRLFGRVFGERTHEEVLYSEE